jgi:hypothetical protein
MSADGWQSAPPCYLQIMYCRFNEWYSSVFTRKQLAVLSLNAVPFFFERKLPLLLSLITVSNPQEYDGKIEAGNQVNFFLVIRNPGSFDIQAHRAEVIKFVISDDHGTTAPRTQKPVQYLWLDSYS